MEGFLTDEILEMDYFPARSNRNKPVKRKWREIEAIKDRQRLRRELMELDICNEYSLEDIDL